MQVFVVRQNQLPQKEDELTELNIISWLLKNEMKPWYVSFKSSQSVSFKPRKNSRQNRFIIIDYLI